MQICIRCRGDGAGERGPMKYLSLFSGAGGGDLGLQHFLGWRCLGYVEINKYCQRVLRKRQDDGYLDIAPIFGDIRAFLDQGYAARYRGMVDAVAGGFPCQPFSVAGRRKGESDERNLWPETRECLRVIGPRYGFFENVPGLLASGYFHRILGEIAAERYDPKWLALSAAEIGAWHKRERLWIVVDTHYQWKL